jgi:hypothetical protein
MTTPDYRPSAVSDAAEIAQAGSKLKQAGEVAVEAAACPPIRKLRPLVIRHRTFIILHDVRNADLP